MSYKTSLFSILVHSIVFALAIYFLNEIEAFQNAPGPYTKLTPMEINNLRQKELQLVTSIIPGINNKIKSIMPAHNEMDMQLKECIKATRGNAMACSQPNDRFKGVDNALAQLKAELETNMKALTAVQKSISTGFMVKA